MRYEAAKLIEEEQEAEIEQAEQQQQRHKAATTTDAGRAVTDASSAADHTGHYHSDDVLFCTVITLWTEKNVAVHL